MAEITTDPNKESPIPFIKRSELESNIKAKNLREELALPPPPGERVSFDSLLKWLKLVTPEMQADNRLMLYVYRMHPPINRQLVDPTSDNNIDVISSDFDTLSEQYFIDTHGGGKYKIVVADQSKGKKQFGGHFEVLLTINMMEHPPKLNLREVDWTSKNAKGFQSWCRAKGLIDENNMPIEARTNGLSDKNELVQAMKLVMDYSKELNKDQEDRLRRQLGASDPTKGVQEILLERMKQDDPNKQLTAITSVISAIKSVMPTTTPSSEGGGLTTIIPMFMQMMEQQSKSADRQFQLMLEMVKGKGEGTGEGRDEISRLKDLITIARELKGGSASAKSQVAEIIDAASPIVTPAFQMISNIFAFRAAQAQHGTVAANASTPANVGSVNTPANTTTTATVTSQDRALEMAKEANATTASNTVSPTNEAMALLQQFRPIILNKLAGEGWEFGAWIADGFGDAMAASVVKHGPDALLNAAKGIPDFWTQIEQSYGEPYLKKWLESFCNYKEELKKVEEED
jgi:hypothetical protein